MSSLRLVRAPFSDIFFIDRVLRWSDIPQVRVHVCGTLNASTPFFDRVVPGFLVQTGDRTGTGGGGESFYGGACVFVSFLF